MSPHDAMPVLKDLVLPIVSGVVLAGATGFRAFLPLAVVSWSIRLGWLEPHSAFQWLGSDAALLGLSVAVILEFLGDKIPVVDHFLDAVGSFVKPAAATLAFAPLLGDLDPWYSVVIAILGGATVATGVHLAKAKSRLAANAVSFGLAAPVLSVIEDIVVFLLILLALLLPLVALAAVVAMIIGLIRIIRGTRTVPPSPAT